MGKHRLRIRRAAAAQILAVPESVVAPAFSGIKTSGQTVTSGSDTWTNLPILTREYQHQRLPVDTQEPEDISGATTAAYVLTTDDVGAYVRPRVRARNANGLSAWVTGDWYGPVNPPLSITGAPALTGNVGAAYSFTPTIVGGTSPYSLVADILPAGLAVSDLTITGTPTTVETVTVTLTVTDADGLTATMTFTLAIASAAVVKTVLTAGTTWTAPSNLVAIHQIRAVGPGGRGAQGGAPATNGGGGGGGGAYSELTGSDASSVDIRASDTVTVSIPTSSTAQSPTLLKDRNGTTVISADYGRNATAFSATGAAGGLASNCIGTTKYNGGNGGNGVSGAGARAGGGGGGAGGPSGHGVNGSNGSGSTGGAGGAAGDGTAGGASAANNTTGKAGTAGSSFDAQGGPGGGGGGGGANAAGGAAGAHGGGSGGGGSASSGTAGRDPGASAGSSIEIEYTTNGSAATLTAASVSQYGVTFVFSSAVRVGQYANGDWWALAPVTITSILPASTTKSGSYTDGTAYTGRVINGAMVNPGNRSFVGGTTAANATGGNQGWDSIQAIGSYAGETQPYTASLNVDPGATGSSIVFAAGEEGSVVKAISSTDSPPPYARQILSDMAVLTVVATVPADGDFRPGIAGSSKASSWNVSDIDYSVLPDLSDPAAGKPSIATAKAGVARMFNVARTTLLSGPGCRNVLATNNQDGYGQDIAFDVEKSMLSLLLNYTDAEKETLAIGVIQYAIDLYSRVQEGGRYPEKAFWMGGGNHALKPVVVMAACMLNDAGMKAAVNYALAPTVWQDDRQIFTVSTSTLSVSPTTSASRPADPYYRYMVGMPEWGIQIGAPGEGNTSPNSIGSNEYRTYRNIVGCSVLGMWLCMNKVTGARAVWNNEAWFQYMERLWNWKKTHPYETNGMSVFTYEMLTAHRPAEYGGGVPTKQSITAEGAYVWITYDRLLDENSIPAVGDFAVTVAGSPATISRVQRIGINSGTRLPMGYAVELSLASAVTAGQAVTAAYTQGTNKIKDIDGGEAVSFTATSATNIT